MKILLLLCASLLSGAEADFTFVVVPDIHINQGETNWPVQSAWIVANKVALNIQGVFLTGDTSNGDQVTDLPATWTLGLDDIDGMGVPWLMAPGNHDLDSEPPTIARDTTYFDAAVGYDRISGKAWYGGYYTDPTYTSKANQYVKFDVGSQRFLVLGLELCPRSTALTWAAGVIRANPGRQVLIITHIYAKDGGLVAYGDLHGCDAYGFTSAGGNTDGVGLAAWAAGFPAVRAIFSGHYIGGAHQYRRTDNGILGFFTNYQDVANPDQSKVVLLVKVRPSLATIEVMNWNTTADSAEVAMYSLGWRVNHLFPMPSSQPR